VDADEIHPQINADVILSAFTDVKCGSEGCTPPSERRLITPWTPALNLLTCTNLICGHLRLRTTFIGGHLRLQMTSSAVICVCR
jgi:hypothetical protein